jgi:hypothetical protein
LATLERQVQALERQMQQVLSKPEASRAE